MNGREREPIKVNTRSAVSRLLTLMRPYAGQLVLCMLFALLANAATLASPAVASVIIDDFLREGKAQSGLYSIVGLGILYLLDITKEYRQIRKNVKFKDSKARKVQKYHKFTVLLQSVYAVCNLLLSFWGGWLVVGIIPITLHFMVSYAVTENMDNRLHCSHDEWTAIEFWRAMGVVSLIAAFCSMLIVSAVVS